MTAKFKCIIVIILPCVVIVQHGHVTDMSREVIPNPLITSINLFFFMGIDRAVEDIV